MKKVSLILTLFFLSVGVSSFAQESDCADAIDNDGDGLIDMNDPDCACSGIGGVSATESMIPNPSFEDYTCCPSGFSQLGCAVDWIQSSPATSDYWNECGYTSTTLWTDAELPAPDGSGWAGFISGYAYMADYNEMIGACLTGPMLAGVPYVLNFWLAQADGNMFLDLTLYGAESCAELPWGTMDCPVGTGTWQELGNTYVTFTTSGEWVEVTLSFTPPVDIDVISIGGPCGGGLPPSGDTYNYYYIDDITVIDSVSYASGNVVETGNWCDGDLQLEASIDTTATAQWYLDGVALIGETSDIIDVMAYGAGDYTVVYSLAGECIDYTYTIVIPADPMADFTWNDQCEDLGAIDFTDASTITTGTISSWGWDFDDGGATSALEDPSFTFSGPGTYNVELTVSTVGGCANTITYPVTIYPEPNSDFEFSVNGVSSTTGLTGACLGDPVDFVNNSTVLVPDNITITNWDFGDGNTSAATDPSHTYAADGSYVVELAVESNNGCQDTITVPVDIFPNPVADYAVTPVCENVDAVFTNTSTVTSGAITGFEWNFDDGSADDLTAGPINHNYANGTYNTQLVVTTDNGCMDSMTIVLDIYDIPVAEFTTSDICFGENSDFIDASTIVGGAITTWSYNFDDGSPFDPTASPTHLYGAEGVYTITLTVTSDQGCVDDTTITHMVTSPPVADFIATNVCQEFDAPFSDASTISVGTITNWEWNFGDATAPVFATTTPTHPYASEGTYDVTLIVQAGSAVCADTITKPVTIHPMPVADFTTSDACQNAPADFTDMSTVVTGSIANWDWQFGEGGSSTVQNTTATYGFDGDYNITLTVTTDFGCVDTETGSVTIHPEPIAAFSFSPQVLDVDHPRVEFNNSSLYAGTYEWDFGDGTPLNSEFEPEHTYPDVPGEYTIWLDVWSPVGGCKDSTAKLIIVKDVIVFHVPNVFTPDGDDYNETFKPIFYSGYDPFDYHLTIFNRWGEIVFESHDAQYGWNGAYGARGLVEDGTYIWQIEFRETMSDKRHKHKGHVTILK